MNEDYSEDVPVRDDLFVDEDKEIFPAPGILMEIPLSDLAYVPGEI